MPVDPPALCNRNDCPLVAAHATGQLGGVDAEAHALRIILVELIHKQWLLRTRLRALGVDPDFQFQPQDIHG